MITKLTKCRILSLSEIERLYKVTVIHFNEGTKKVQFTRLMQSLN